MSYYDFSRCWEKLGKAGKSWEKMGEEREFCCWGFPNNVRKSWGIVGNSQLFPNMLGRTAISGVNVGNSSGRSNLPNVGKMLLGGTWGIVGKLLGKAGELLGKSHNAARHVIL